MSDFLNQLRSQPRQLTAVRVIVGVVAATAFMFAGPVLTTISRQRPGIVPVGMAIILAGLMHPRIRHWVIVTLSYSVALLALRDATDIAELPSFLNNSVLHVLYPFAWLVVGSLAAAAGFLEAREPGNVMGRRFYFATVCLYLTGHGLLQLLWFPSWDAIVLIITGVVAGIAVIFADRMYLEPLDPESVAPEQTETDGRLARISRREWHDSDDDSVHAEELKRS